MSHNMVEVLQIVIDRMVLVDNRWESKVDFFLMSESHMIELQTSACRATERYIGRTSRLSRSRVYKPRSSYGLMWKRRRSLWV